MAIHLSNTERAKRLRMKQLTDLIHALFCKQIHSYEMIELSDKNPNKCYYYLEDGMADSETQEEYLKWEIATEHLKEKLSLPTDEDALKFIITAMESIRALNEVVGTSEIRRSFIRGLLK